MAKRLSAEKDSVRTFLCIEVPESIRTRIGLLQSILRGESADVGWVNPLNIHLTLKFLGSVPKARIESIVDAARRAAAAAGPFRIEVGGAGCFPSKGNPRVLWVGLTEVTDHLLSLHESVEEQIASEGFNRENRPFSPHLTIGRLRSSRNARKVAEALVERGFPTESFEATELTVMRSDVKPTGAIYTPLSQIPLGHGPKGKP